MIYTPKFVVMAFANLCILAAFGAFFLFPVYITERGGREMDIGILMGAFALASVLCRPWISEMVDSLGRKRSYTIGCSIMTIMPLCHLLFPGEIGKVYIPLLVIRIVHGVGFAICITAAFTYVADMIPRERLNEGIGIFGVSGLTGSALGPAVAEIAIGRFGFDALFLGAAGLGAAALVIHLPISDSYRGSGGACYGDFFKAARRRGILPAACLSLLFGFGLSASNNFVSPYVTERNLGFVSIYYIACSGAAILTRVIGCRLMDRIGETRLVPLSFGLAGGGLLCMIPFSSEVWLAVAGFMMGCGQGFLYPLLSTLTIRDEPAGLRGKITGVFTGSVDAGVLGGAVVLGFIGEMAGFGLLFLVAAAAFWAGVGLFRVALRRNWLKEAKRGGA